MERRKDQKISKDIGKRENREAGPGGDKKNKDRRPRRRRMKVKVTPE